MKTLRKKDKWWVNKINFNKNNFNFVDHLKEKLINTAFHHDNRC